jgi:urease accessory protein
MESIEELRLLQIADSALAIGAAAHSFGLETLVDSGMLHAENLEDFLGEFLKEAGALEAGFVRRAARGEDPRRLSDELAAWKPARESREAAVKLGRRFAALMNALTGDASLDADWLYPVAFGVAGRALGLDGDRVVLAYLEQFAAGLISACQRLMPIGQHAAARILWNLKPAMIGAAQKVSEVTCFTPLPELASMRHGRIETRLFIS